jgi:hypothetical protein
MNIASFIKKLFGCKEEELQAIIDSYKPNSLEEYYNNKYPKVNLTYLRKEIDGDYQVDLREFINKYNYSLPIFTGTNDEIVQQALVWVIINIKYVSDFTSYVYPEYWAYDYQTFKRRVGDCEDGAILLYNILLKNNVPYWKIRLSAGWVNSINGKEGHCYVTYYCEETDKWVVLDWCYWPNMAKINERKDYKGETNYIDVWFSWNMKYCYSKGLNADANNLLNI